MDANQRSEMNNQTNNGGNEKWNANAKGKTAPDAPLDHTYPQGASQQQGRQGIDQMGTQQSGMGPGPWTEESSRWDLPGGSMQTQQSGGSGPTQSITDSHQRQMEQRSEAYGQLEQPVGGHRPADSGTDLLRREGEHAGNTQATHAMNPQDARQPELQGGSLGHHHGVAQPVYGSQSMQSAQSPQSAQSAQLAQSTSSQQPGNSQRGADMPQSSAQNAQDSTDRAGSQTGEEGRESGTEIHQSNDVAGGLPRSPGNSGPRTENPGWQPGASMKDEPNPVHQSNDAAGGYPKSPAGANRLAGDRKMDDDTGFSRK